MELKTVWCEWDIGQNGLIFASEQVAERWLRNNQSLHAMAYEEDAASFDEYYQLLVDNGFICLGTVELIE